MYIYLIRFQARVTIGTNFEIVILVLFSCPEIEIPAHMPHSRMAWPRQPNSLPRHSIKLALAHRGVQNDITGPDKSLGTWKW